MRKFIKYLSLSVVLIVIFFFGCPTKNFFNLPCPACGVTTAWMCLLKGDLVAAFKNNFFFLPLTMLFIRIIYCDIKKEKIKKLELVIFCFIGVLAFLFNAYRILKSL